MDPRDVLIYIRTEETIRWVLPPEAHDEAIAGLRDSGYYTFLPGVYSGHAGSTSTVFDPGSLENKPVRGEEVPEDEEEAIRRAGFAVVAHGRRLHVVDVGKESALRRMIAEHLHHLRRFPVLVRPDGRRLEGADEFTEEKLAAFLADLS